MNVVLPEKDKVSKKRIAIYVILISICVLALIVAVCVQILGNDFTNSIFGVSTLKSKTEEEEQEWESGAKRRVMRKMRKEQELRVNFDNLFLNNLQINGEMTQDISKIDENQDYVFTKYSTEEKNTGNYELSINIPYINIDSEVVNEFNTEIEEIFERKVESILESEDKNVLFTIEYQAYVENNILSVIIKSNLKQGSAAQQVIVQTYNYDLLNQKEVTLSDEIELLGLDKNAIQSKIREEIKQEQQKAEDLQDLGYEIYSRDSKSDMYDIENSNVFFLHEQNLYIIYPYGNDALTSEMDLVII